MSIEAGRTLDALVAERVMGLETGASGDNAWVLGDALYVIDDGHVAVLPHYSTDIAAAWLVVERVRTFTRGDEIGLEVSVIALLDHYDCHIETNTAAYLVIEKANTAPHAVCLAALKAVGALE